MVSLGNGRVGLKNSRGILVVNVAFLLQHLDEYGALEMPNMPPKPRTSSTVARRNYF